MIAGSQPISQFAAMLDLQPQSGWLKANEGSMLLMKYAKCTQPGSYVQEDDVPHLA